MRSSKIKSLPEPFLAELRQIIIDKKHTQIEILQLVKKQGLKSSTSAIARYCLEVDQEASGYALAGIPKKLFAKHKTQFDELGRLLTKKLFIDKQINDLVKLIDSHVESQEKQQNSPAKDDQKIILPEDNNS